MGEHPIRVQLRRTKGWKMPPNTVRCARPGPHGNPFRVGGYFMMGDPDPRRGLKMTWCESLAPDSRFTLIETNEQAVQWFRRYAETWGEVRLKSVRALLGGKNLACFCALDQPCHADVLIELANLPESEDGPR